MSNLDDIEPEVAPEVARGSRKVAGVALVVSVLVLATYLGAVANVMFQLAG